MGSGGKALRDGQQRPFMSSAGSPRSLRGALMQPFGGDASRPLCPGSEVEGSGEGWGERSMWLPIEGTGGGAYEALELEVKWSLPGVRDCGEVSTRPVLTSLPRAEMVVSERRGTPDIRTEVGVGSCGSSYGSGAPGGAADAKEEVEA